MLTAVKIKNFRSIEAQDIPLPPIVFLYGNNAAGKSSLFYSLNVLRNIVSNPNQPIDQFFNLGFGNLGGFRKVVSRHDEIKSIGIFVEGHVDNVEFTYGVNLNPKHSEFKLALGAPYSLDFSLPVNFPYPLNASVERVILIDGVNYKINWTGTSVNVIADLPNPTDASAKKIKEITLLINKVAEQVRSVDLISVRRGFFEPQYGAVNINQFPIKEEEVASMLAGPDENLDHQVSTYLEQITQRQFRAKPRLGTSLAELTTIDQEAKINSDVVNDGFGVNQLVFVLAKVLNKSTRTACLEEPESNLHPGAVRRLPKTFIEIAKKENKQLLITTHSEPLIVAMLSAISNGDAAKEDIGFYLTIRDKETGITTFAKQEVSDDGEISGGLKSFMVGELEDIKGFLKPKKKKNVVSMTSSLETGSTAEAVEQESSESEPKDSAQDQ